MFAPFDFCADLVRFSELILSTQDDPAVYSISYGWQGNLTELGCTDAEVMAFDNDLAKVATRNITIIFSSGDSGSGQAGSGSSAILWPEWPASSPWVTSVGGTYFVNGDPSTGRETAVTEFGSGGGFSFMFPMASWQTSACQAYLNNVPHIPPTSSYPANGRGTPDVSALGWNFQIVENGQTISVGGTSASAPSFAGMISLINDQRQKSSKGNLGFLNQWIYQNPTMFRDVLVGNNAISRGGSPLQYGWYCTPGWDAATGFGTPDFPLLLQNALSLP